MTDLPSVRLAQRLALALPAALLAGAYISQYGFGLFPCEMCWWQRWPHFAALAFAALSYFAPPKKVLIALAAGGLLTSGAIGFFHAGVEYDLWEGVTSCAAIALPENGESALDAIMNSPVVRCDEAPWTLFGISLAGFNFLFSTLGGLAIFRLLAKDKAA